MKSNLIRTKEFKNNELLDELLNELKELLAPIQKNIEEYTIKPQWPLGFIIGNPRSGTTLFLQWAASLGIFSYPTNFLTRFAYAPYIGACIQKLIFDKEYDFQGEFGDIHSELNFISNLGKSKGALATNEFQHFFRNYIDSFYPRFLKDNELNEKILKSIRKGLATIEYAYKKPFITKGIMLQYNIDTAYKEIPELFFFYINRNPLFIMQSIYLARKKYYDDPNAWWSVKPKEYPQLKKMDVYHQVAGQVFFTETAINIGLENVPVERKMYIDYEEFCDKPEKYFNIIKEKYSSLNYSIPFGYSATQTFKNQNKLKLSAGEIKSFTDAYHNFQSGKIKPKE